MTSRHERLNDLPALLVTPERFGKVLSAADIALGDTIEFEPVRLPETARIYDFPQLRTDLPPTVA